jgi:NADH-quinone oxidoreductase subunit A
MDEDHYLTAFGEVLLFIIAGIVFILVTLLVSRLVQPSRPNPEKLSTYESGEEAVGAAWSQFNIRFYIVALVFLLFEVEIVFLFPWSTVFADQNLLAQTDGAFGWYSLVEMIIFIGVLALGLAYAWVNGFLDWVKPNPSPTQYKSVVPASFYAAINKKYGSKEQPTSDEK